MVWRQEASEGANNQELFIYIPYGVDFWVVSPVLDLAWTREHDPIASIPMAAEPWFERCGPPSHIHVPWKNKECLEDFLNLPMGEVQFEPMASYAVREIQRLTDELAARPRPIGEGEEQEADEAQVGEEPTREEEQQAEEAPVVHRPKTHPTGWLAYAATMGVLYQQRRHAELGNFINSLRSRFNEYKGR